MSPNASGLLALVLCCWAVLLPTRLSGQQTNETAPQAGAFKIEVKVNSVLVPVVVRDAQGRAVDNLKKEDFQLFDQDEPRAISGFTIQKRAVADDSKALEAGPSAPGGAVASASPRAGVAPNRFIVFLFDDLHLNAGDLAQVQQAGTKMLAASLGDSDVADVISIFGRMDSGMTRDRAKLQETILKLRVAPLYQHTSRECPDVDYYHGDLIQNKHNGAALEAAIQDAFACANLDPQSMRNTAEGMARTSAARAVATGEQDVRVTLGFVREVVRRMGTLPGQRTLILVSPGFPTITQEAMAEKSQITDMAAQANVTISALDARGLYTMQQDASERSVGSTLELVTGYEAQYHRDSMALGEDVMSELADGTGGTYFHNSNNLEGGLKTLAAAPECVYLLELSLEKVKEDGTYHRLKVKVDQDGLKLQARRGYFAPKIAKDKK
jgi:VWFA-related protein